MAIHPPPTPPLATDAQGAARALGISSRGIERLLADGVLPSFRVGRRRLIAVADIEHFIAERKADG